MLFCTRVVLVLSRVTLVLCRVVLVLSCVVSCCYPCSFLEQIFFHTTFLFLQKTHGIVKETFSEIFRVSEEQNLEKVCGYLPKKVLVVPKILFVFQLQHTNSIVNLIAQYIFFHISLVQKGRNGRRRGTRWKDVCFPMVSQVLRYLMKVNLTRRNFLQEWMKVISHTQLLRDI